ncbi:MAG: hypothetical protein U0T83_07345 [Bacteriovoracaceae bacterium]
MEKLNQQVKIELDKQIDKLNQVKRLKLQEQIALINKNSKTKLTEEQFERFRRVVQSLETSKWVT